MKTFWTSLAHARRWPIGSAYTALVGLVLVIGSLTIYQLAGLNGLGPLSWTLGIGLCLILLSVLWCVLVFARRDLRIERRALSRGLRWCLRDHKITVGRIIGVWDQTTKTAGLADDKDTRYFQFSPREREKRQRTIEYPNIDKLTTDGDRIIIESRVIEGKEADDWKNTDWSSAFRAHRVDVNVTRGIVQLVIHPEDALTGVIDSNLTPPDTPSDTLTPIRVGRLDDGNQAAIDLRDAAHTIIQGQTRSGKSAFCYGVLGQLAHISENRLQVWGIDPNQVLLAPWHDRHPLRIALGLDFEHILGVLETLMTVMDERLGQLLDERIDKFDPDNPDHPPLLVVVFEEYAVLIEAMKAEDARRKPAERVRSRIESMVGRLFFEGAKVGVRVILIVQRADADIVGGAMRSQAGTTITFGVDRPEAVKMLVANCPDELVEEIMEAPAGRALLWRHRQLGMMQADRTEYAAYREAFEGGEMRGTSILPTDPPGGPPEASWHTLSPGCDGYRPPRDDEPPLPCQCSRGVATQPHL